MSGWSPPSFDDESAYGMWSRAELDYDRDDERAHSRRSQQGKGGGGPPKLTDEQRAEIRSLVLGGRTRTDVAKEFGVSQSAVSRIVKGAR